MKLRLADLVGCVAFLATTLVVSWSAPASASTLQFSSITSGRFHSCGITVSGAAYCWGQNPDGELGNGTTSDQWTPVPVSGGHTFASISAGIEDTCGVTTAGDGYCWGRGDNAGQLGDGGWANSSTPVLVTGGYIWSKISTGWDYSCGITTTGTGYCWGWDNYGTLGNGAPGGGGIPQLISGSYTWSDITASMFGTCGITSGTAYCWGLNDTGEVGDNTTTQRDEPTTVLGGYTWATIYAGAHYFCGLTTAGIAYCWGMNNNGELGDGTAWANRLVPTAVLGGYTWSSLSAATWGGTTCGIRTTGALYCWGYNGDGQYGDGTTTPSLSPSAIGTSIPFTKLVAGSQHTCGITNIGIVYCWGYNGNGRLGDGTTTDHLTPNSLYFIASNTTVSAIVDPSLTFSITGRSSTCNGQSATGFQTGSSATSVSLGHISSGTLGGGAQDLSVSTNAANGFIVYLRTPGTTPNSLSDGAGHTIADVTGTRSSPGGAPVAGTAGFGYTSDDSSTAFTSNTWAKLTNSNDSVLVGTAGTTSKTDCVGFEVAIASTTPAGTYSSTAIYTAVPTF